MENFLELILMVLQGLSTSVIDVFFLMTALVALMTVFRFSQFSPFGKPSFKKALGLVIELIVQGILMGALFSFAVVLLGLPILYSDYLYFLLPLSFIIGFYHIRYTSLNYAALGMGLISLVMNGQNIGDLQVPNVEFSVSGIAIVTGLLMLMVGALILLTGDKHMIPIAVKTASGKKLGFGVQRFWPIPVVLLAGMMTVVQGDTVAMPDWWPLLKFGGNHLEEMSLFLLPLLFVMSYGSVSFSHSPEKQFRQHGGVQLLSGLGLLLAGLIGSWNNGTTWFSLMVMVAVVLLPEMYWKKIEDEQRCLYDLEAEGIYVVGVEKGTLAHALGFKLGDLMTTISGVKITTMTELIKIYKDTRSEGLVVVHRGSEGEVAIKVHKLDIIDEKFGLRFMPDKPSRIYEYNQVANMNMMNLMRMSVKRNDAD